MRHCSLSKSSRNRNLAVYTPGEKVSLPFSQSSWLGRRVHLQRYTSMLGETEIAFLWLISHSSAPTLSPSTGVILAQAFWFSLPPRFVPTTTFFCLLRTAHYGDEVFLDRHQCFNAFDSSGECVVDSNFFVSEAVGRNKLPPTNQLF